ncbi:hypothetical protein MED01_004301 [Micromonospora sp. MED01]|uniref:hypothetical protein n=1 Tax=Micromonospora alfalfae TaxID=2911212 RepID=UPI001EE8E1F2|nr:hypothetical protein [Micromonospora alfalfae]MCG5460875.1 hypothetical protein [Micromonospora alfalfae]
MSRYKTWMITGCTAGSVSVALFIGLATHVFLTNPMPNPRFTVLAVLDILLGVGAALLIIGGKMCRWISDDREEYGNQRWWKGYSAAVEDLKGDATVHQLPVPPARNGRHG